MEVSSEIQSILSLVIIGFISLFTFWVTWRYTPSVGDKSEGSDNIAGGSGAPAWDAESFEQQENRCKYCGNLNMIVNGKCKHCGGKQK